MCAVRTLPAQDNMPCFNTAFDRLQAIRRFALLVHVFAHNRPSLVQSYTCCDALSVDYWHKIEIIQRLSPDRSPADARVAREKPLSMATPPTPRQEVFRWFIDKSSDGMIDYKRRDRLNWDHCLYIHCVRTKAAAKSYLDNFCNSHLIKIIYLQRANKPLFPI